MLAGVAGVLVVELAEGMEAERVREIVELQDNLKRKDRE